MNVTINYNDANKSFQKILLELFENLKKMNFILQGIGNDYNIYACKTCGGDGRVGSGSNRRICKVCGGSDNQVGK